MTKNELPKMIYMFEDKDGNWLDWGTHTTCYDKEEAEEFLKELNSTGDTPKENQLVPEAQPAKIVSYFRIEIAEHNIIDMEKRLDNIRNEIQELEEKAKRDLEKLFE